MDGHSRFKDRQNQGIGNRVKVMTDINDLSSGNLFVTGELGSGKTMFAVKLIQEYLRAGRKVATNLDLFLDEMMPQSDRQTVIRLPDKPIRLHFDQLGDSYPMKDETGKDVYDESKFGLIVLDECLTWLNSRSWQDKERAGVLDWFLHARKHGWNVVFLLQSADFCDPQLRQTLLTYHVSCRKMAKYRIPIIGKAFGLRMPKGTLATILAGYGPDAIVHAREIYRGSDLYQAYKTRQVFQSGFEFVGGDFIDMRAPYTMLSAWHVKGRHETGPQIDDSVTLREIGLSLANLFIRVFLRPAILFILLPFYPLQVLRQLSPPANNVTV